MVIIIILLGGYLVYDEVIKDKINNTNIEKSQATNSDNQNNESNTTNVDNTKTDLDINSNLVQRLYAKVSNNNNRVVNTFKKNDNNQDLDIETLDYKIKLAMALSILNDNDKTTIYCSNYKVSDLLPTGESLTTDSFYSCGKYLYNPKSQAFDIDEFGNIIDHSKNDYLNNNETVYYENSIKNKMQQLFGKDYYTHATDILNIYRCNLKYLEDVKGYVQIGNGYYSPIDIKDELENAGKSNNSIILEEKSINNDTEGSGDQYIY